MKPGPPKIPDLFRCEFEVDARAPFRRHLNRLEVEIGREDYRHLKRVELVDEPVDRGRLCRHGGDHRPAAGTTQNNYNRTLLEQLGVRVYLDVPHYAVYYRFRDGSCASSPPGGRRCWRGFSNRSRCSTAAGRRRGSALPGFAARYLPDGAGGVLLLRRLGGRRRRRTAVDRHPRALRPPHPGSRPLFSAHRPWRGGADQPGVFRAGALGGRKPGTAQGLGGAAQPEQYRRHLSLCRCGGHPTATSSKRA